MSLHDDSNLTGKLLIALPAIGDSRFHRSVIWMCVHTPEFAMGLIVNKPLSHLKVPYLFEQLSIPITSTVSQKQVLDGGPVASDRGFVLHTDDVCDSQASLTVSNGLCMTTTRTLLETIAGGAPPRRWQIALGYSGWGAGQIESELAQNAWLVADADNDLLFSEEHPPKWQAALARLGIEPGRLQVDSGNA